MVVSEIARGIMTIALKKTDCRFTDLKRKYFVSLRIRQFGIRKFLIELVITIMFAFRTP